jgi:sulfite reductase (ferredoxin)
LSVEDVKRTSHGLGGTLATELGDGSDAFEHDAQILLKFHGIYQQDDRDTRRARTQAKLPLDRSLMVRASVPGGAITREQWSALDRLAEIADGSLRLTTRQGVQFHVVPKGSLHDLVAAINRCGLTTLAACGDVVRNTMACPVPDARQAVLQPVLAEIVRRFRPTTPAYWDIWLDGERAVSAVEAPPADGALERVYGDTYLPRKFKIGLAWPGDNCVDVLTHDVGIVPTLDGGEVDGFTVFAGGGLGMNHSRPDDTFPLLGQALAWAPREQLAELVEAVVIAHRDHGNREDRQRARLKYVVHEHGIEWLRDQVSTTLGRTVEPPRPIAPWVEAADHHGWAAHDHGDTLGLPVPNGRVRGAWRDAFRTLVHDELVGELRVTPRQDVLLTGINDREAVVDVLRRHGLALPDDVTPIRRLALACPALPTCGQALGEAERVLPELTGEIEAAAIAAGIEAEAIHINMTGCPNGCARPYSAEIGIVGRTKRTYDLFLGGSAHGERLTECVREDVPLTQIASLLSVVFQRFAIDRNSDERFGDFCRRVGATTIATWLPAPEKRRRAPVAAE